MNRKELDHLLGMYEMEEAVEQLLQQAEQQQVEFQNLEIRPGRFSGSSLIGLCHLMCRNLIEPSYPNGEFAISNALVERMREREVWKEMPYPPTLMEKMEKRMPWMKEPKGDSSS